MEVNYFDLAIGGIILLLGLKGVLNGFFKELFGLIGIVGGVFVASRVAEDVGQYLSDLIFHFQNNSAISFTGFLVTLALFWALMITIGFVFKKLSSASGLGVIDRVFGFVLGASKFFLIISMIAYAMNNIEIVRKNIEKPLHNSMLYPILVQTGSYIMHMQDTQQLPKNLKQAQTKIEKKVTKTIIHKTTKEEPKDLNSTQHENGNAKKL